MTTWAKKLTRCTSLLVALGLLLGLTVTGCSEKDREGGTTAELANIDYVFALVSGTPAKADLNATTVILYAYDADGITVAAEQHTQIIADHIDVTPEAMVGTTVYEAAARVDTTATKLVLKYYNAEGNEVGTTDVLDNVIVKEGAIIDFTTEEPAPEPTPEPTPEPSTEIKWTPDNENIVFSVDDIMRTITATDAEGNPLSVVLESDDPEGNFIYIDHETATIYIIDSIHEGDAVTVTATAKDSEGNDLDEMTYYVTFK